MTIKSAFAASSSSTTEVVKTIGLFIMQSLVIKKRKRITDSEFDFGFRVSE
jgi:hypothetical protein